MKGGEKIEKIGKQQGLEYEHLLKSKDSGRVPALEKVDGECQKVYTDCQYVNTNSKLKKEEAGLRR